MARRKRKKHKRPTYEDDGCPRCEVCDTPMTKLKGYAGTGMCGPCCTGEAATLDEFGDTW